MKKPQNLRIVLLLVLSFAVAVSVAAQNPVLEWKDFNADAKGSDGKTYMGITFAVSNWSSFSDSMFAAAPDLPACGLNKNSSQTWLDIFNYANNKRIYGFCALGKAEDMKSLSFNVKREGMPDCIYITLTDRRTKKTVKSNPIRYTNNTPCEIKPKITIK